MNYRHVYMLIIKHAKSEMNLGLRPKNLYQKKFFPNQYFEFHHILPKSLFPLWKKRKSNLVALTAREHFFCHQLLTKIYCCNKMLFALHQLCIDKQNMYCKVNSKLYEKIKISYIKMLSEKSKGNTYATKSKGYKVIHKNDTIIKVPKDELNGFLQNGWKLGTGKKAWNTGMTMPEEIVEKYKASHAYLKKQKPPKTKKKRKSVPRSIETRNKISKSLKGIKRTPKQLENYRKAGEKRSLEINYRILLVNTGEIFNSLKEARNKYPQGGTHILDCLSGKRNYAGLLDGTKMIWQRIPK